MSTSEQRLTTRSPSQPEAIQRLLTEARRQGVDPVSMVFAVVERLGQQEAVEVAQAALDRAETCVSPCAVCQHNHAEHYDGSQGVPPGCSGGYTVSVWRGVVTAAEDCEEGRECHCTGYEPAP